MENILVVVAAKDIGLVVFKTGLPILAISRRDTSDDGLCS